MKINWFSPLPPARSELARQTTDILPLLSQRAEVTVWSSDPLSTVDVQDQVTIKHFDANHPPWREISAADITFYQMGNDPRYHHSIWRISRQYPGVVILHDIKLQHFFGGLLQNLGLSAREYLELLELHHGPIGRGVGESFLRGHTTLESLAEQCPLTDAGIENALAVIVHWNGAWPASAGSSVPVIHLPLGRGGLSTAPAPVPAARQPNEPYHIIVFGFLGPNRRLPSLLAALARFPERERFCLDVYGTMEGLEKMEELIARLRLTSLVTLHGFVPEEELEQALRRSDLAINLRSPTMGEASASQLHLWQYAVPTLVTRSGWYATLPAETVGFVSPDNEVADIEQHLAAFLADPEQYRALGLAGQRRLNEQHTVEAYVNGLIEVAERVGEFQAKWIAHRLAQRAGANMSGWYGSTTEGPLWERVAEEIQILAAPKR